MKSAITLTTPPPLPTAPVQPYEIFLACAFTLLAIFCFRHFFSVFIKEKADWRVFWASFYFALMPACFFVSRVLPGEFGQFLQGLFDLFVVFPLGCIFAFYLLRGVFQAMGTSSGDDDRSREYYPYTDKTQRYRL